MSEHLNRGRKWKLIMQYLRFLLSSIDKTKCSLSDWVYYGETCPPRLSPRLVICEVFFQGVHRYSSQVKYKLNSYQKKKLNDSSECSRCISSSRYNILLSYKYSAPKPIPSFFKARKSCVRSCVRERNSSLKRKHSEWCNLSLQMLLHLLSLPLSSFNVQEYRMPRWRACPFL